MEYFFSGAYSGIEDAVYARTGKGWWYPLPAGPLPTETANFTLAAVVSPDRFACNGDYANTYSSVDAAEKDPHYHESEAILIDGAGSIALGAGAATAARATYVVRYSAGTRSPRTVAL